MSDIEDLHEVSDAELESIMDEDNSQDSPSSLGDDGELSSIDSDSDGDEDEMSIPSGVKIKEPIGTELPPADLTSSKIQNMSDDSDEDVSDNNSSLESGESEDQADVTSTSVVQKQPPLVYSDSESDDDDVLDNKFELEGINDFLINYHPESKQHNYDEIYALSRVVRDKNGVIIDSLHKTLPILSKYEKTRILGQRAKQINSGNQPFVTVDKPVLDGYLLAEEELKQKKIPFIIRRPLPNGGSEYWRVSDLEVVY